jgi:Effector Associated Constant Component 1
MSAGDRLLVQVHADDDPDAAFDLGWDLMDVLRESPADAVEATRGDGGAGSKGPGALEWANLIVTFTGGLPVIVGYVRSWLSRQEKGTTVKIVFGDETLELGNADPETARRLTDAFLARHQPSP